MSAKAVNFIKETKTELKKVTWPTRQETLLFTAAIVVSSAVLAFFMGGLDYLFQVILNRYFL